MRSKGKSKTMTIEEAFRPAGLGNDRHGRYRSAAFKVRSLSHGRPLVYM